MNKKVLSILILISFTVLGIIFLKGHISELKKILEIDLRYVILVFILTIFADILRGYMFKLLMENYNIKFKFKEWLGLQVLTAFWNILIPFKGGVSAKAVYLKKIYKFPYTLSASVVGITYLINFLVYGLFGIILSFFSPVQEELKYGFIIFSIIILFSVLFLLFFLPLPININMKIVKYVVKSINEIQYIRKKYLLIFKLTLNSITRFLVYALTLYFAFQAFNSGISLYFCLIITLFLSVSTIISITPMDLGFRESIVAISSKSLGAGALTGIFVVSLDRVVTMIWLFIAAPIFSYILLKDKIGSFKVDKMFMSNKKVMVK